MRHVAGRDIFLAPGKENGGIDDKRSDEVHQHTTDHHQQTLPGRLIAETLFRGGVVFFEILGRGALVDHSGNVHITSKGEPSQMIVRTMECEKFKRTAELSETEIDTGVKEDAEFLDTNAEKLGKEEMSALVQQHKEHETEQQLGGFNQKYFHWMNR